MKLEKIVEKSWNKFLEHPRWGGLVTFFAVDNYIGPKINPDILNRLPALNRGISPSVDAMINMYKLFTGDQLVYSLYFYTADFTGIDTVTDDILSISLLAPVSYYLSVKINRLLSLLHTGRFKSAVELTRESIERKWIHFSYKHIHKDWERYKKELIHSSKDSRSLHFTMAHIAEACGETGDSLDYYRKAFNSPSRYSESFPEMVKGVSKINPIFLSYALIKRRLNDWKYKFNFRSSMRHVKEDPDDISSHIRAASHLYFEGRDRQLKRFIKNSLNLNETLPELRFFYAMLLDEEKDVGLKERTWMHGLDLLLKQGDKFEKIADTRNEVFEFGGSGDFLKHLFVFKRSGLRDPLLRDHVVCSSIYKGLWKSDARREFEVVPEPLHFFRHHGDHNYYNITKREDKVDLERLLESGEDIKEHMVKAIENLVAVHAIGSAELETNGEYFIESKGMRVNLSAYDYIGELDKRLFERLGRSGKSERMLELYLNHLKKFNHLEFLCHGDLYLSNVLEDGLVIDFDRAVVGNPSLDLGTLIDSAGSYSYEDVRDLIDNHYLRFFGSENSDWDDVREDITRNYFHLDRIHSLICEVGSKYKRGKIEKAREYIIRGSDYLTESDRKLRDAFLDYVHSVQPTLLE